MKIKIKYLVVLAIFIAIGAYIWHVHFNFRFEEISKNKVYKSALIDPDKIDSFLQRANIKTVINLLDPGVQDALNPAKQEHITREIVAIDKYNAKYNKNVKHVNIQSQQVPTKDTLKRFFEVLDDKSNYPVLIHCYHGTGRAAIYSAVYRIEYENWKNQDAINKTRFIVEGFGYRSSFAKGKSKGDFLLNYKKTKKGIK